MPNTLINCAGMLDQIFDSGVENGTASDKTDRRILHNSSYFNSSSHPQISTRPTRAAVIVGTWQSSPDCCPPSRSAPLLSPARPPGSCPTGRRGASCTPRTSRWAGRTSAWPWGRYGRGLWAWDLGSGTWSLRKHTTQSDPNSTKNDRTRNLPAAAITPTLITSSMPTISQAIIFEHFRDLIRASISPVPHPESRCPPSCFTSHGLTATAPALPICTDVRACAAATAPDKADCAVL